MEKFTLQLLHASDFEAGVPAAGTSPLDSDAVRFSAVLNQLRSSSMGPYGVDEAVLANTLTLASGDTYIPGPFLNASSDLGLNGVGGLGTSTAPVLGRGDIGILNALGIQASAFGNHEFDLGTRQVRDILRTGSGNPGTSFPYLSTNLDFSLDENLRTELATNQTTAEASTLGGRIAKSTVITVAGLDGVLGTDDDESIGVVGATTPLLRSISSPGDVAVLGGPTDFEALAAEIQTTVDILTATGINKVILLTHMQQFEIEANELAPRLRDVDIIVAGGSHSLFANDENPTPLRAGDSAASAYPTLRISATEQPVLVVNTPANYRYVGRLVVEFDADGMVDVASLNPFITGAYATDQTGIDTLFGGVEIDASQFADPRVVAITDGIRNVIASKDNNLFGATEVFLNGTREFVRTEETNFGNVTADANLALAQAIDPTTVISIKNGGGIRDNIGSVSAAPGAVDPNDVLRLPPQPSALSPDKPVGAISQLDVENALRFNNTLSLITLTATQLKEVMEHAVAATTPTGTPGQFPQIGGFAFSFDPTGTARTAATPGSRVNSLALIDANGNATEAVVIEGQVVGDPDRTFRLVTLNFLADGGDSYPFAEIIAANADLADRVDLLQVGDRSGAATFADTGSEQDAFAEYMLANFGSVPFSAADTSRADDTRIQNLNFRNDTILAGLMNDGSVTLEVVVSHPGYEFQLMAA
jgi:2',3'-cyclic-nucleotide 2'-phosphodiesterase (5'-nucleotidase family)